jgi:dTDP-4-amino-4,6-dideoxygalactose transaminase
MTKLAIKGGKAIRNRPFSPWPLWGEKERTELLEVLKSGNWSYHARKHEKQTELAKRFARFHDANFGICTSCGAAALTVSLRAAGVEAGDEVIVPALTFVATASAAMSIGATPVFVDVDSNSYCIDVDRVQEAITERTKAVIPVHLYSSIADMDRVTKVAEENDLVVVEDCAHVPGSKWRGKGVGSIGALGCFSFQQSKIMTAGEGGMIVTSDEKLEELCTSLVDCGRIRKSDSFAQNVIGWNYRMTEFQAAILLGQLQSLPSNIAKTEKNAEYLSQRLGGIDGIQPLEKDDRVTRQSYYYYVFRYDRRSFGEVPRDRFMAALFFEGIPCEEIYEPVYKSPLFRMEPSKWPMCGMPKNVPVSYSTIRCPIAEKASYEEAVAIPHVVLLGTREDVDDVVAAIEKIKNDAHELHKADSSLLKAVRTFRRYGPQFLRHPTSIGDIIGKLKN